MFEIELNDADLIEYVPDYKNNRELARACDDSDRNCFWVKMKPLSGRVLNKITGGLIKNSNSEAVLISAEKIVAKVFSEYVVEVGGLKFTGPEGDVVPRTGAELYDTIRSAYPALGEIIDDVYAALRDKSKADEGDLKKLR